MPAVFEQFLCIQIALLNHAALCFFVSRRAYHGSNSIISHRAGSHRSKLPTRSQHLRVRVSAELYRGLVARWFGSGHLCTRVPANARGCIRPHAIRTSYQGAPDYARQLHSAAPDIQVHGTQYLLDTLSADDKLLIVDDVFATGRNMLAVLDHLKSRLRKNFPEAVRIACLYEKPTQSRVSLKPDFVLIKRMTGSCSLMKSRALA